MGASSVMAGDVQAVSELPGEVVKGVGNSSVITLSADAHTRSTTQVPPVGNMKLKKKGSFSNLFSSLGKRKGSSSSLVGVALDQGSSPADR